MELHSIYYSKSGFAFNVQPNLTKYIETLHNLISSQIKEQKDLGKFVAYISVPISPRGGGDFITNNTIASYTKEKLQSIYGEKLWILNPAEYNLPKTAKGGDYMALWADILAGEDGTGEDFDLIYFLGPNDVWKFFQVNSENRLDRIQDWIIEHAKIDQHYNEILNNSTSLKDFLKYYGISPQNSSVDCKIGCKVLSLN